jgi:hypothetical protein
MTDLNSLEKPAGASENEIKQLIEFSQKKIPASLIKILAKSNGFESAVGSNDYISYMK